MKKYLISRLIQLIPVLIGIGTIVFLLMRLLPGDVAAMIGGADATFEQLAAIREKLGLNQSLGMQYVVFLRDLFTFDFGTSLHWNEPVVSVIFRTFPASLELATVAMLIALMIAVPLGILSAIKHDSVLDYGSMIFSQIGQSMPAFWVGMLLILLFAVNLNWLPSFGRDASIAAGVWSMFHGDFSVIKSALRCIILPAATMGFMTAALIARMIRSTVLEVLNSDYIRTARAKGTVERRVIFKHAFRNALLPVITIVGLEFGNLLGCAVVTESVFSWPGLGSTLYDAILQRDFPLVQGGIVFFALCFTLINLLVDILYCVIDPRIRR